MQRRLFQSVSKIAAAVLLAVTVSGCVMVEPDPNYTGPAPRPASLDEYYSTGNSYHSFSQIYSEEHAEFNIRRFLVKTDAGEITVDYFQRHTKSAELILVFPVLGGKNMIENYFADYFARNGFDTAIVHRDKEFKDPGQFERLEDIFRNNVIRDRIALDFFTNEFQKSQFASFGISRGAMNAATTAGVDPRLGYNVLALGGADLVPLFQDSGERGVQKYRTRVMEKKQITAPQFYRFLQEHIKTDPKLVAKHIDARQTMMILSVFDSSVPLKYGLKLRESIGYPRTVFLASGHYSALAFTGMVRLLPNSDAFAILPPNYIETEALAFYRTSFHRDELEIRRGIFGVLRIPFQIIGEFIDILTPSPPRTPAAAETAPESSI